MIGTLVNVAAVLAGGAVGLLLRRAFPPRITRAAFQAIGIFTLFLGVAMALRTSSYIILVFSALIGGIAGELLRLEERIERGAERLKRRLHVGGDRFAEGLVTAFLLFCMGSMTILGAIEEGMGGRPDLLMTKSLMDGFSAAALAAAMGAGVLFSAVPLLVYQGGITLAAAAFGRLVADPVVAELTAMGGLVLLGMGLNVLGVAKICVMNLLPGLVVAAVLAAIFL